MFSYRRDLNISFSVSTALNPEETESALEATSYFTEDVTTEETQEEKGRRNDSGQEKEEKGTSPQDYRYYLRMWAKEKESKKETIKDLPKMSQVRSESKGFQLDD